MGIKLKFFALILLLASNLFAQEQNVSSMQLVSKSSLPGEYFLALKNTQDHLPEFTSDITRHLPNLASDFAEVCGDRDYDDYVVINSNPEQGTQNYGFVCKRSEEGNVVEERTYDFVWKNGHLDDVSVVTLEKKEARKNSLTFKAAVKHSFAILASLYLSTKLIQRIYPNEHDKITHGKVSGIVTAAGSLIGHYWLNLEPTKAVYFGMGLSWLGGFGREVKQGILRNDPNNKNGEWKDIGANTVAVLLVGFALRLSF